jgi:hypothetical protein
VPCTVPKHCAVRLAVQDRTVQVRVFRAVTSFNAGTSDRVRNSWHVCSGGAPSICSAFEDDCLAVFR